MINIAVVLSACSYSGELNRLPACEKDSQSILKMIKSNNRFSEILVLHDEPTTTVNDKIFQFLKSYEDKKIGDFLFYFSGHGEYHSEDFFYLMKDYKSNKRRQTSLINSELDDAVRSLQPRVYAKIVDACQSGISYVKSSEALKGYLEKSKPALKDLYFLFSSQFDQSSWQGSNLSDFTASIIDAACQHPTDVIKYKDVINFVVDNFDLTGGQTPFFVNQGSFTDVFCEITPEIKSELLAMLTLKASSNTNSVDQKSVSISELVKAEASIYCSKEEALFIVESLPNRFINFHLDADFDDIYNVNQTTGDIKIIPNSEPIGTWLDLRREGEKFFAKPTKTTESYQKRVPKTQNKLGLAYASAVVRLTDDNDDYTYITAYREKISGFHNTIELPVEVILIVANSDLPNLPAAWCFVVPIISRTTLRAFYAFAHYEWIDWDKKRIVGQVEWQSAEALMKDELQLSSLSDHILANFKAFVQDPIRAKFKPTAVESPSH